MLRNTTSSVMSAWDSASDCAQNHTSAFRTQFSYEDAGIRHHCNQQPCLGNPIQSQCATRHTLHCSEAGRRAHLPVQQQPISGHHDMSAGQRNKGCQLSGGFGGRGRTRGAGPRTTLPWKLYCEPWQGHMNLFSFCAGGHSNASASCIDLRIYLHHHCKEPK